MMHQSVKTLGDTLGNGVRKGRGEGGRGVISIIFQSERSGMWASVIQRTAECTAADGGYNYLATETGLV